MNRFASLLLVFSIFFVIVLSEIGLLSPTAAIAQPSVDEVAPPPIPENPIMVGIDGSPDSAALTRVPRASATATLVAASLETAGYQMQSIVLSQMGGMLNSLGALIYIACAMVAITYFAIHNRYDNGLWFLIGPGLFYWLVFSTVQSAGVDWQSGNTTLEKAADVNKIIGNSVNARVSWFFDEWNQIVSEAVTGLVSVIAERGKGKEETLRSKLKFTLRQQVYESLFNAQLTDGALKRLIYYGIAGECRDATDAARKLALGRRDSGYKHSPEYRDALTSFKENFYDPAQCLEGGKKEGASSTDAPSNECLKKSRNLQTHLLKDSETRNYLATLLSTLKTTQTDPKFFERMQKKWDTQGPHYGQLAVPGKFHDVRPGGDPNNLSDRQFFVIKGIDTTTGVISIVDPQGQEFTGVFPIVRSGKYYFLDRGVSSFAFVVIKVSAAELKKGKLVPPKPGEDEVPIKAVTILEGHGEISSKLPSHEVLVTRESSLIKYGPRTVYNWLRPTEADSGIKSIGLQCLDWRDLDDPALTVSNPISCYQIWCWTGWALRISAEADMLNITDNVLVPSMKDQALIKELWQDIAAKMSRLPDDPSTRVTSDILLELGFPVAGRRIEPDPSIIPTVIAGILLRRELNGHLDQNALGTIAEHTNWVQDEPEFDSRLQPGQLMRTLSRIQQDGVSQSKRYEIFTFAMSLPYLQGALLYFLAMLFPFFGCLLYTSPSPRD